MRHESIVVVYDSCQAIAEEIASKLGAETLSIQSLSARHIGNSQSFVLAAEFQTDGQLTPPLAVRLPDFSQHESSRKEHCPFRCLRRLSGS